MNKEEIKEYLKRTDELELKLTGEDKDTFQWVLFGYNECARLLNEKEHILKELRSWLEEYINILKEDDIYDRDMYENGEISALESVISKLNELEGKNDN